MIDGKMLFIWILFMMETTFAQQRSRTDRLVDMPCAARQIEKESVVCVCNATYCDNLLRLKPQPGLFVQYLSSKSRQRFNRSTNPIKAYDDSGDTEYDTQLELDVTSTYQRIVGFGGAVTDAAGINWKNVSVEVQDNIIQSYFGGGGIGYNMIRVPIGGTDFSTRGYAYNELPENDVQLTNYTLPAEDLNYKIPMIKAAMKASKVPVHVLGTVWSPPLWMKTRPKWYGPARLKEEYYQTYADYHIRFMQRYKEQGIDLWAISTTNEPLNGLSPIPVKINCMGWTPKTLGTYIHENLGPTIRNSSEFKHVKILVGDDQRYTLPLWVLLMLDKTPEALQYLDGVAVHWYGDRFTPALLVDEVAREYPQLFILGSEACQGSFPWQTEKVVPGSWERGEDYAKDIVQDLSHGFVGWLEWNLCLNPEGGPTWVNNNVDSLILVYSDRDEFIKQPMYYVMGHFSRFLPRDSVRVGLTVEGAKTTAIAFQTPEDTIVVIVLNSDKKKNKSVRIKVGKKQITTELEPKSIATIEFLRQDVL